MPARYAFLDDPMPAAFAHRGGGKEATENTMGAFQRAVDDLGYRYLETDVRATADGVVAIFHDDSLERVTDGTGKVSELRWADVAGARTPDGQGVARLEDALAAWPDIRWNIDAKHDGVVEPLADIIQRAGALERVCITSFSDRRLTRVRRLLGPRLCTSMGPLAIAGLRSASYAPALTPDALWRPAGAAQVPMAQNLVRIVDHRFVAAAHGFGLAVHVWTIDDEATMEELLDLGVDGIMTDRPSVLRDVLVRRNAWGGA